jgi:hypothetical protein
VTDGEGKIVQLSFVGDEREATYAITSFDISKGLVDSKAALVRNILHKCDADSIKQFDQDFKLLNTCTTLFSELDYFQALVNGMQVHDWPTNLKLEGKNLALKYVRYFSEGDYPLLNRLAALSVLDELSVHQFVNPSLHGEIKAVMTEAQNYVLGLNERVKRKRTLDCSGLDVIREELLYSQKVGAKLKDYLGRL